MPASTNSPDWKHYQREAADFFRSLGLQADTDQVLQGVRTSHDVDVLVKAQHAGFDVTWIVECKHWQTRVSKRHVLALREIVVDTGADRGILLAESGFQSGAVEAATLTNVHLTSLATLRVTASAQVYSMRLRDLYDRLQSCNARYWAIGKYDRIAQGLRPDVPQIGYSGDIVIKVCDDLVRQAFRGVYPVEVDSLLHVAMRSLPARFESVNTLCAAVDTLVTDLETKLSHAERALSPRVAPPAPEAGGA